MLDVSVKMDKKVVISGKSMLKTIKISSELGYLKIPENLIIPINSIDVTYILKDFRVYHHFVRFKVGVYNLFHLYLL